MKRFDLQNYIFFNFEIEILSLRYAIKSQLIFLTLDVYAPHRNKMFLHVRVKHVVDIRKITLHYHKTLTLGVWSSSPNVRYNKLQ